MRCAHIFRVYTRDQLQNGAVPNDQISRRVINGFNQRRSPDINSFRIPTGRSPMPSQPTARLSATTRHVPVIFMGAGINPGRYNANVAVNDIAPTLATILDVETPSGSVGRVLTEIW